jgi:hypothetical protein
MVGCVYAYTYVILTSNNLAQLKRTYVQLWVRHEWKFNFVMTLYHFCLIFTVGRTNKTHVSIKKLRRIIIREYVPPYPHTFHVVVLKRKHQLTFVPPVWSPKLPVTLNVFLEIPKFNFACRITLRVIRYLGWWYRPRLLNFWPTFTYEYQLF